MNFSSHPSIAEQLIADLHQESQFVDQIIQACIEYRWATGADEQEIAKAMVYNAFETYATARGIPLQQAESFCEDHLEQLIHTVLNIL